MTERAQEPWNVLTVKAAMVAAAERLKEIERSSTDPMDALSHAHIASSYATYVLAMDRYVGRWMS